LLAWTNTVSVGKTDIWVLTMGGENESQPFLATEFNEGGAMFSPDGRWLAYVSDESGRNEVYAQEYPGPGGKWQVSNQGGVEPVWSRDGRELFYRNGTQMMVVEVEPGETFVAGEPRLLFEGDFVASGRTANYDVSPDGQHFVMALRQGEGARKLNVIVNWFEELKRLAPPD
jgi:Tol biopolymer transport system component